MKRPSWLQTKGSGGGRVLLDKAGWKEDNETTESLQGQNNKFGPESHAFSLCVSFLGVILSLS